MNAMVVRQVPCLELGAGGNRETKVWLHVLEKVLGDGGLEVIVLGGAGGLELCHLELRKVLGGLETSSGLERSRVGAAIEGKIDEEGVSTGHGCMYGRKVERGEGCERVV